MFFMCFFFFIKEIQQKNLKQNKWQWPDVKSFLKFLTMWFFLMTPDGPNWCRHGPTVLMGVHTLWSGDPDNVPATPLDMLWVHSPCFCPCPEEWGCSLPQCRSRLDRPVQPSACTGFSSRSLWPRTANAEWLWFKNIGVKKIDMQLDIF